MHIVSESFSTKVPIFVKGTSKFTVENVVIHHFNQVINVNIISDDTSQTP